MSRVCTAVCNSQLLIVVAKSNPLHIYRIVRGQQFVYVATCHGNILTTRSPDPKLPQKTVLMADMKKV